MKLKTTKENFWRTISENGRKTKQLQKWKSEIGCRVEEANEGLLKKNHAAF